MAKKFIGLTIAVLLLFSLAACNSPEEDYNGKEVVVGDFSITITVDKTEVSIGETIEISAILKNVSEQSLKIVKGKNPVCLAVFSKDAEPDFDWDLARIDIELAADDVLEYTVAWAATEKGEFFALAHVRFSVVEDWNDDYSNWTAISIQSKKINIKVI